MIFVCVLLFVVEVIGCEKRTLTHKTTLSHQHHCLFIGLTQQYGCCCADGLWWAILCLLKPARKTKNTLRTFALELNSEIEPQLSQHCKHLLGLCLSIERTSQSKHAFDWDADDLGHGGVVYWRSDNVPKQPCGGWQWVIADPLLLCIPALTGFDHLNLKPSSISHLCLAVHPQEGPLYNTHPSFPRPTPRYIDDPL